MGCEKLLMPLGKGVTKSYGMRIFAQQELSCVSTRNLCFLVKNKWKMPHGSLDADATNILMECRILLKLICMPTIMTSVHLLLDHSNSHPHLLQNRGRINGHAVSQGKTHYGTFMPQAQQASQSAISSRESSTQKSNRLSLYLVDALMRWKKDLDSHLVVQTLVEAYKYEKCCISWLLMLLQSRRKRYLVSIYSWCTNRYYRRFCWSFMTLFYHCRIEMVDSHPMSSQDLMNEWRFSSQYSLLEMNYLHELSCDNENWIVLYIIRGVVNISFAGMN